MPNIKINSFSGANKKCISLGNKLFSLNIFVYLFFHTEPSSKLSCKEIVYSYKQYQTALLSVYINNFYHVSFYFYIICF